GQWIAASEWQIREIFQQLMARSYQKILQAKLDAAPQAAFSPSKPNVAQQKGRRLGPHRSLLQNLDAAAQTPGHEMGQRPCRSNDEPGRHAREWPGGQLLAGPPGCIS